MKSVLHTSYVPEEEEPLGRFEQTEILRECISSSLSSRAGTSIYVSGLPGTGSLPVCFAFESAYRLARTQHAQGTTCVGFCI